MDKQVAYWKNIGIFFFVCGLQSVDSTSEMWYFSSFFVFKTLQLLSESAFFCVFGVRGSIKICLLGSTKSVRNFMWYFIFALHKTCRQREGKQA